MLKPIMTPIMKAIMSTYFGQMIAKRWAYNFDGVDDRGQLTFRAIDPDGDIDVEWEQGDIPERVAPQSVVSQCISATIEAREFYIRWSGWTSGRGIPLAVVVGGTDLIYSADVLQTVQASKGLWRVLIQGVNVTIFKNNNVVFTKTVTKGSAREPNALTVIGARTSGASFTEYFQSSLRNVKINGVLYPIADKDQSIQLPSPAGLGAELITQSVHENPHIKGSQWTHLGDGRWQYIGDGSYNSLQLIAMASVPESGYLTFEVESITGGTLRCTATISNIVGDRLFDSVGVKRVFYTVKPADWAFVRNVGGAVINCVIKNIIFRPLYTTGLVLPLNGSFATDTGWSLVTETNISSGTLNFVSTTTTRAALHDCFPDPTKWYVLTYTVTSISSGRVRFILYGNAIFKTGTWRNATGTYSELIKLDSAGGSFTNKLNLQGDVGTTASIDNVSVTELATLCNPLNLINTTPDRWEEIDL